jgi:hypothetical protein
MRLVALAVLLLFAASAQAHKPSSSYLQLAVQNGAISGRWDIALRDLDYAIGLDANGDGEITWGEVRAAQPRIAAYLAPRLSLDEGGSCSLQIGALRIVDYADGAYAALDLSGRCPSASDVLALRYDLLFDLDALHRGLLRLDFHGPQTAVLAPERRTLHFYAGNHRARAVFAEYFREGLWHVWTGADHMLFLAGLFLPAVLRRRGREWIPAPRLGPALRDTALMATAFTLAHACTLTLAAIGAFSPPARWVETAVAATVLFAGLNNLVPMVYRELYWLAGAFGFIHGAAIAGTLNELGLPPGSRVWALLAFNLGVEAAQLSVLLAVIPPSFACRRATLYRRAVLVPGALAVSLIGLMWFLERALSVDLGIPLP